MNWWKKMGGTMFLSPAEEVEGVRDKLTALESELTAKTAALEAAEGRLREAEGLLKLVLNQAASHQLNGRKKIQDFLTSATPEPEMVRVRKDDLEAATRWTEWTGYNDSYEYDRLKAALERAIEVVEFVLMYPITIGELDEERWNKAAALLPELRTLKEKP
jgi:hypothetical protein